MVTDHLWMCKRINYRHLFYYEMANVETLAKLWGATPVKVNGPFAYFYLDPHSEYDDVSTYTEVPELPPFLEAIFAQTPWTPARFVHMVSTMKTYYKSQVNMGFDYTALPYQWFYLQYDFAKILNLALNATKILTGNTFINLVNSEWRRMGANLSVARTLCVQVKHFINSMVQKWDQTSYINERYYFFSQKYFETTRLNTWMDPTLSTLSLQYGQVADFYYLNYFFGLPNRAS